MQLFLKLHDADDGHIVHINYANIISMRVVGNRTELATNGVGSIVRQTQQMNGSVEHYTEIYALTYYVKETPEQIMAFL